MKTTNRSRKSKFSKLNRAFALMREKGILAKQRYWCCQSCAGYAITEIAGKRVDKGQEIIGCCYYHDQDYDDLKNNKDFRLAYGSMEHSTKGQIGIQSAKVGAIVCECLEEAGIQYEWNGSEVTRILVKTSSLK